MTTLTLDALDGEELAEVLNSRAATDKDFPSPVPPVHEVALATIAREWTRSTPGCQTRPVSRCRWLISQLRRADRRRLTLAAIGLTLAAIGLSACGSSASGFAPYQILLANTHARTVQLTLDANATDAYGGFNFDGYGNGALQVRVPVGWTVQVACDNGATTISHSCAIVDDLPVSTIAPPIAFPGASIPDPTGGLVPGGSTSFTFVASRVGRYRMTCLVPSHEVSGMWDWFVVTAGGLPSIRT